MKRRVAHLPLHSGKAPPWLFKRMTKLAGAVTMAIVEEFGPAEMLRRLSDPWWFQAFGCVLGFDWHSSGVTTVTCGALKEAAKICGPDLGILVAGGKGGTSRKTPQEIADAADRHAITAGDRLVYASRMSAKVDSAAVQDGFAIYHHSFFFTPDGQWCVVQQGMDERERLGPPLPLAGRERRGLRLRAPRGRPGPGRATGGGDRRQAGSGQRQLTLLNMVAEEAGENRRASAALVREPPDWLMGEIERLTEGPTLFAPARHPVLDLDVDRKRLKRILDQRPRAEPAGLRDPAGASRASGRRPSAAWPCWPRSSSRPRPPGAIPRRASTSATMPPRRSLRSPTSTRRWADYSYAHGGKDGTPFPVDRDTYDRNIAVLTDAVRKARLGENDKFDALRRLSRLERSSTEAQRGGNDV